MHVAELDGVAPRAKMNQQRSRRFRSAREAQEKDDDKEEYLRLLKSKKSKKVDEDMEHAMKKKTWDSNSITPGTPFMDILASSLRFWCSWKLNTDPAWAKVRDLLSDVASCISDTDSAQSDNFGLHRPWRGRA